MSRRKVKNALTTGITLELMDHSLPNAEKALILKVLRETDWNLKQSAKLLNIARGTLYSKMEKYEIERPF